jgi:hypothetical protein
MKPLPSLPVTATKKDEHDRDGEGVGPRDAPPRQRLEQPLREHGNEGQGEHLEAADQHDEDEQQGRLAVGPGQQPCRGDAEQGERCPVK